MAPASAILRIGGPTSSGPSLFLPNSEAAIDALDAALRASLADSLVHVHEVASAKANLGGFDLAAALAHIRAHRVSPGVFGRYYDLVFAVEEGRHNDVAALFREIAQLAADTPRFAVVPFTVETLAADAERYGRLLSLETGRWPALTAPDRDAWHGFERHVATALDLLHDADAALASELRALVVQLVGMGQPLKAEERGYAGITSFMLWGAVFLNIRQHPTPLDLIAGLIHEAAHLLLFGLSLDEPLVENAIEERYGSPLRTDPRPMDGIFHATFVCARMHYAFARLREGATEPLHRLDRDLIARRLTDYRDKFFDGLATVERFGRLTPLGVAVLDAAHAYMRSAD